MSTDTDTAIADAFDAYADAADDAYAAYAAVKDSK